MCTRQLRRRLWSLAVGSHCPHRRAAHERFAARLCRAIEKRASARFDALSDCDKTIDALKKGMARYGENKKLAAISAAAT